EGDCVSKLTTITSTNETGEAIIGSETNAKGFVMTNIRNVSAPPRIPANAPALFALFHQIPSTNGKPKDESKKPPTQPTIIAISCGGLIAIIIPIMLAIIITVKPIFVIVFSEASLLMYSL